MGPAGQAKECTYITRRPDASVLYEVLGSAYDGAVLADAAGRIARQLARHGLGDDWEADRLARDDPLLATLHAASVQGRVPGGARTGEPTVRMGDRKYARLVEPTAASATACAILGATAGKFSEPTGTSVRGFDT